MMGNLLAKYIHGIMDTDVVGALDAFYETLHNIRARSAIADSMQYAFTRGGVRNTSLRHNFLLGNDYLKLQLLDMRKFFEEEKSGKLAGKTHVMDSLIRAADSEVVSDSFKKLKEEVWEKDFEKLANKKLFHLDKEYEHSSDVVDRGTLESLSDKLYVLLKMITDEFAKKGIYPSDGQEDLDNNGEYLQNIRTMALAFYDLSVKA